MAPGRRIAGMLLCRSGESRVAFAAREVATIELPRDMVRPVGAARQAFGEPEGAERVLVADSGEAVGVDALEIDAEPLEVLPVPVLLRTMGGGSLRGFVLARGMLWPLVSLVDFGRYLAPPEEVT